MSKKKVKFSNDVDKGEVDDDLQKYDYFTVEQHIKEKSMWLGTKTIGPYEEWLFDSESQRFVKKSVKYSPALLKCFWELTCNAIDASIKNPEVRHIFIKYDKSEGMFSIYNDGGAIPVKFDKRVNQWLPEAVATNPFSGSNLKKDKERRTGGTNGLGLKLCNFFASKLVLESYDGTNGYSQTFSDRMKTKGDPEVIPWDDLDRKNQIMRVYIEFYPYWKGFGYKGGPNGGPDDEQNEVIYQLVQTLAYQTAAYVRRDVTVKFNDEKIPIKTLQDYAKMFCDQQVSMVLTHETDPWDVIVGIHDGGTLEHQSFVNGIYVRGGGDHMKALENKLVDALKDRAQSILKENNTKRFNRGMIINHLFIFQRGDVPNPDFDGQRKDQLRATTDKSFKKYELPKSAVTKIWNMLKDQILATYAQKQLAEDNTSRNKRRLNIPGLREAEEAAGKHSAKCRLLLFEGNSAEAMGTRMKLGYKYFGMYNLRGVPINARKQVRMIKGVPIRSKKWSDEKNRLRNVLTILGLDHTKNYKDPTELDSLRYGGLIMMVDQDIDGVGNIMSLVLNALDVFWPNLLRHGYVQQLATPLIRAFPKSRSKNAKTLDFYSDEEYKKWVTEEFGEGNQPSAARYKIKYYKGLATHEPQCVAQMAKTFDEHLVVLPADKKSPLLFESFFGKNSAPRKKELAKPMADYSEYEGANEIPLSIHLMRDTKQFQNEKNYRNLKCFSDGMNPSRRKILMGALDTFAHSNDEMKVFQFAGAVANLYQYHHGDQSLNGTVIRMGQQFLGSNYLPLLRGHSEFGSRLKGGEDHGSPRYIEISLNKELIYLLYPTDDRYILDYKFEDGVRSEPKEWPSIIPMTLVERCDGIGTGWRQKAWAREVYTVISNVERKIKDKSGKPMPPEHYGFKGNFRIVGGCEYSVGVYEKKQDREGRKMHDCIHITELPISVWSDTYLEWLEKQRSDLIHSCSNQCDPDDVDIKIYLKDGALKTIEKNYGNADFTPIENCFQLYCKMETYMNFTDSDGIVREFKSYDDVFDAWFEIRKRLYQLRIKRLFIMTKLRIKFLENIIRFCDIYKDMNLPNKPEDEVLTILEKQEFTKFTKSPIDEPKYVDIKDLKETYLGDGATYNYLVSLSTKDMYEHITQKRKNQLEEYRNLLVDVKDQENMWLGAKWWLRELEQLKDVIAKGRESHWMFGHTIFQWK